jgi:ABC-type uncharacterized transport system permease subunit
MTAASSTLPGVLAALCAAGAILGFAAWGRPSAVWLGRIAQAFGLACLALSVLAWIVRWAQAGHMPLFGTFESSLSLAVAVLLCAWIAGIRLPGPPGIWPVACVITGIVVWHGLRFDSTAYPLTISERSWVVDVHAVLAWGAFGTLAANAAFAARRLLAAGHANGSRFDRVLAFTLSLGFCLQTAMLVSGSIYKFLLFGSPWSFDPIETLGFVAWIAYGTLLHMHLFAGWKGRRLALWSLGLFVLLIVSYRGIVYFPAWSTYHILDMDLRMHLTGEGIPGGGTGR